MKNQSDFENVLAKSCAAFAEAIGKGAAKYHTYVERENEMYRNQCAVAQALQTKQAEADCLAEIYPATANYLMTAIYDTAPVTALLPANSIDKLYAAQKTKQLEDGTTCLVYRGWIRIGVPVSAQKTIQKTLQKQLNELTMQWGFPALDVSVKLCSYNEVIYLVRFRSVKQEAKK